MKIEKAEDGIHKWVAYFKDGTKTKFGRQGYSDFLEHQDKERRRLYRLRHAKDLKTNDPKRAGFLSYYLLWNKTTLKASIEDYKKRFGDL